MGIKKKNVFLLHTPPELHTHTHTHTHTIYNFFKPSKINSFVWAANYQPTAKVASSQLENVLSLRCFSKAMKKVPVQRGHIR
jgi:hypothetical protein